MIDEVRRVLSGKYDQLLNDLHEEMLKYSSELKFEKANEIKQKINSLRVYSERQKVVSGDYTDKDILTCAYDIPDAVASIFNIRAGKLVGKKKYVFNYPIELDESEIYSSIIQNYYRDYVEIPPEIVVKKLPQEKQSLEKWLKSKTDIKVKIVDARKDEDTKSLMNMCYQNAFLELNEIKLQRMKKEGKISYSLKSLQRDLFLKEIPIRIECFDISTLQGSDTVASLVVFENAKPKKSNYKKFIIKTVAGTDDFKSMSEVIERHYRRVLEEKLPLPNLIMVDGGKGQLSSAIKILTKLGIKNIPVIGLAKRLEEVYLQNQKESLMIPKTSSSLKLLQQIRDEAHRFAVTFHRERRSKRTFQSELEQIKGIGTNLTQKLLTEFESIEKIKSASLEQLESSVGKAKAKIIFDYFSNKSDESSN
ncbi:MAG: excinuclease ABC subunit UvrC, partial [Ignavibacteria bacterium]|nr:excinuclease ABC subunit UvrC [Ignavibacteria bacterium]